MLVMCTYYTTLDTTLQTTNPVFQEHHTTNEMTAHLQLTPR